MVVLSEQSKSDFISKTFSSMLSNIEKKDKLYLRNCTPNQIHEINIFKKIPHIQNIKLNNNILIYKLLLYRFILTLILYKDKNIFCYPPTKPGEGPTCVSPKKSQVRILQIEQDT